LGGKPGLFGPPIAQLKIASVNLEPSSARVVVSCLTVQGSSLVPEYRAYLIGDINGHRFMKADFLSNHPDDATAMSAAKQLLNGHDVELWDCGRFVARFSPEEANPEEAQLAPEKAIARQLEAALSA
jgi:hypothetical protein